MGKIIITWSKLIPLKKENIEELDASIAGVYRLSKKSDDGKYYVFFVGSAENLRNKLLLHLSSEEPNNRLKQLLSLDADFVFRYAVVAEQNIREAIEKQMYKHYIPEYNIEEPKSSLDIEANLN